MKTLIRLQTHFALQVLASFTLVAGATCAVVADQPAEFANISSRLLAERGDDIIVTEFAVLGTGTEYVILRALGPSLRPFGIINPLRDPTMTLLDERGRILDSNDDWVDSPDKDAIIATGLAPSDDREPAIVHTFSRGIYTAIVRGVRNGTGVALAELYGLSTSDETTSISGLGTRGFVGTADNVIISGVIISGIGSVPVLTRALGPSLAAAGISAPLADPTLELHDANGALIASNDNWKDTQEAEIEATGLAPDDDLESAILATLSPGPYTAVMIGVNGATGTGFVQFYSLTNRGLELDPAPIIRRQH